MLIPPPPNDGRMRVFFGAWLDAQDLGVLEQICSDLDLPADEVLLRALRLAGAVRALNGADGFHGLRQYAGDDVDPLENIPTLPDEPGQEA